MNSISFVWARYWVRRFLILNWHETGIWRLRPRREVKSRWRLLDEKNDTILRRCSSRLLQSSSTCWTFSKASHPLRQLGSAFWSIRWRKALRYVCSERRRWRLMFTRLSGEKCQLILLVFSRIFTVVFLQTCRQWIHSAIHWLRKIPICSAADSIFRILFPDGCKHSLDAKLSAVSFPMMPVWLGIQISVTFVPVALRHRNKLWISGMHGFVGGRCDNTAWIDVLESENNTISSEDESMSYIICKACRIPFNSAKNTLDPFLRSHDLDILRLGINTAHEDLSWDRDPSVYINNADEGSDATSSWKWLMTTLRLATALRFDIGNHNVSHTGASEGERIDTCWL